MTPPEAQTAGDGIPNTQAQPVVPEVTPVTSPQTPEVTPAEPETPKQTQFKELRKRKDELLRITEQQQKEMDELTNKLKSLEQTPSLPEPVLASLREFAPDMAPDAAVAHIMDDYRRKTQTLNEREALLQQLDIEHSEVWRNTVIAPRQEALQSIDIALSIPTLDAQNKVVVKNPEFVQEAKKLIGSLTEINRMTIKAALTTVAERLQQPLPPDSMVSETFNAVQKFLSIDDVAKETRANWVTIKEQVAAKKIQDAEAQSKAAEATMLNTLAASARTYEVPAPVKELFAPETISQIRAQAEANLREASTSAFAAVRQGRPAPVMDAVGVHARALMFDMIMPEVVKLRKAAGQASIIAAASGAATPAVQKPAAETATPVPSFVWNPR